MLLLVEVFGVKMKNSLTCYVLLMLCVDAAFAQFGGGPQTQFTNGEIDQRRQLSPQQQGHILSDIQQHQHRFSLQHNTLTNGQQFPPQQFQNQRPVTTAFGQQLPQQQFLNPPPQQPLLNQNLHAPALQQPILNSANPILQNQQYFVNQPQLTGQILNGNPIQSTVQQQSVLPTAIINQQQTLLPTGQSIQQPTLLPTGQPIQQPLLPTIQTTNQLNILPTQQQATSNLNNNRVVQHHTQTSFTPNYLQQQNKIEPTAAPVRNNQQIYQSNPSYSSDQNQQLSELDPEKQKQRLKELKEKQAIIDKHNQFVEKQYEKALKKAQADHVEFVAQQQDLKKKLYQKVYRPPGTQILKYSQPGPRYIYPEETNLFKLAVENYYKEHPTTTTTTTTTPSPSTTTQTIKSTKSSEDSELLLQSSRSNLYSQIKSATAQEKVAASSDKKTISFLPTVLPASEAKIKSIKTLEDLDELQKQYRSQLIRKDDLLTQLRLAIGEDPNITKNLTSREISLENGQKIQLFRATNAPFLNGNLKPEEITLPNGQKVQVIRTSDPRQIPGELSQPPKEITLPDGRKAELIKASDPSILNSKSLKHEEITLANGQKIKVIKAGHPDLIPSTTSRPPKELFEELTKGIVPPGTNLELLKHDASGSLKQVDGIPSNLPNQKKITFVLLEEQSDGTFKVQGVKGNGKDKAEVDVDSILKRIKNGEIKLPPVTKDNTVAPSMLPFTEKDVVTPSTINGYSTPIGTTNSDTEIVSSVTVVPNSFASYADEQYLDPPILKTNIGTHFVSTPSVSTGHSYNPSTRSIPSTTPTPRLSAYESSTTSDSNRQRSSGTSDLVRQASSVPSNNHNSLFSNNYGLSSTYQPKATSLSLPSTSVTIVQSQSVSPTEPTTTEDSGVEPDEITDRQSQVPELVDVLKTNGLYAMAKFLKQSGLDTILNETGPYTIFVPTDKAFRTLLVQLGGPDKADEKFKDNPRLLSGLLLHHVIPGAFTIDSLQDEMTGVSLAGTQLRVNQYNMHDVEWNDVKITTINGAKVLDDKKDIEIPQGVAHGVDRVMFPLPVGDIVQTLQSDRERRFTNFLRALFSSGLSETLQGTKTFTLFAPTDKAFNTLSGDELTRTVSDRSLARALVMRHIVPGTLYTNGMRYYQIKDSLESNRQITLSKSSGKIKVNNVHISTQNIPSTNGVIHAVDSLL